MVDSATLAQIQALERRRMQAGLGIPRRKQVLKPRANHFILNIEVDLTRRLRQACRSSNAT